MYASCQSTKKVQGAESFFAFQRPDFVEIKSSSAADSLAEDQKIDDSGLPQQVFAC